MTSQFERDYHARQIRSFRKILRGNPPQLDPPPSEMPLWREVARVVILTAIVLTALFLLRGCGEPAWSAEIPQDKAVRILVGEASNQGFKGMVCVAEVLRHKGSTKGFYGLAAPHSTNEPKWVWNMAKKAWLASKTTNYTKMADHFENINAFGCPYWVKSCVLTFQYKDHKFYREVKRA